MIEIKQGSQYYAELKNILNGQNSDEFNIQIIISKKLIETSNELMKIASENYYTKVIDILQQNTSVNGNELMKVASENGYTEIVKLLLLDPSVDPSFSDNYAIKFAAANGHVEVVKILLRDKRVDPSTNDNFNGEWMYQNNFGHRKGLMKQQIYKLITF
jgi:hypothetical protein